MPSTAGNEYRIDIGSVSSGIWCESCSLPSVVRCDLLRLVNSGVYKIGELAKCVQCGRPPRQ